MAEKTPQDLLRESLERNAREVADWPSWIRGAISTKGIFSVATSDGPRRDDAAPASRPESER